ncbi:MAG: HU family DNA-binding protein [Planctomycetota bacterium]|nr:HU family DNA-binding protein [Planctomycetota bacterium]
MSRQRERSSYMAGKAMTKTQVLSSLAESTGLSKGQVSDFIEALGSLIGSELNAGNPFNVPGLMKVTTRVKAAVPAGPRTNPFTGETKMGEAKPAQTIVKVRPLKGLKDSVAAPAAAPEAPPAASSQF